MNNVSPTITSVALLAPFDTGADFIELFYLIAVFTFPYLKTVLQWLPLIIEDMD